MKMKRETQALHLARMMQNHVRYPGYELALPPVMASHKKLKKLSVDDVLLTGFDTLESILIDEEEICAKLQLKKLDNRYKAEIVHLDEGSVKQPDSKKYKTLKISFGRVQSNVLELGQMIDITDMDMGTVRLVLEDKTIAEGSLAIVDEKIAIQIKKVI